MTILLTGGAGYIGSHTAAVLCEAGYDVVIYDSLLSSEASVVDHVKAITSKNLTFVQGDVRDCELLTQTIREHSIEAIIHFAGLKAVGDSVLDPIEYFDVNVGGTLALLKAMKIAGISTLVFSSSATVYGVPEYLPFDESHPRRATNPYGRTKLHIEEILEDLVASNAWAQTENWWSIISLRYFNPIGAHDSGLIGETSKGTPNNLLPYVTRVAAGILPTLRIFGDDYPTADGTGVRDYIHVMDLAEGHLAALNAVCGPASDKSVERGTFHAFNLGTGVGYSVFEIVRALEAVTGQSLPYQIKARRPGDIAECYANADKAKTVLGWTAKRTLEEMCESAWQFQFRNV